MTGRFDTWYGGSDCRKCLYYGKSERCWKYRCRHESNIREGYYGAVYMKHPDELNWNKKCKNYNPKGDTSNND